MFNDREGAVRELACRAIRTLEAGKGVEGQTGKVSMLEHLLHEDGMRVAKAFVPVQRKRRVLRVCRGKRRSIGRRRSSG